MIRTVPIGDVAEIKRGSIDPRRWPETHFELYSIPGFDNNRTPEQLMGADIGSSKSLLPDQGVLFSKLNPRINRVWTFRENKAAKRIASTEFVCLVPKEDRLDLEYLGWRLRVPSVAQELPVAAAAATKSRERIKPSSLLDLPILLPPLDEQTRIVGILNRAAKIERLQVQTHDRLREFIPALFLRMFGDPAENPMGWPIRTLGELSVLGPQYGANARSAPLVSGEPRYIRITDIQEGGSLSDESVGVALPEWETYQLRDGDLLFARSGATVGKPYIHRAQNGLCVFAGYLIRFRLEASKLHPEVVFGLTQTSAYDAWVKSKRRTAAQPNINGREYATLRIPVPPLGLQRQYAQIVETARSTAALAESGAASGSALSASLMSRLLGNTLQYPSRL